MKIIFICVLGCGAASGPIKSEADAASRALSMTGGASNVRTEQDGEVWEVVVKMKNDALIEVKYDAATGSLRSVEAKAGPFDYDLTSVAGVVTFQQAVAKANEHKQGDVVAWELDMQPDGHQWEVYIKDAAGKLWEIKLVGDSGMLKSVEEKTDVD